MPENNLTPIQISRNKARAKYRTTEKNRIAQARYRKTPLGKISTRKRWLTQWRKNPEKILSRQAINGRIYKGRLVKPKMCQKCGAEDKIQAHHYKGYERKHRLTVQWLCAPCHRKADVEATPVIADFGPASVCTKATILASGPIPKKLTAF